jgi:uncharacterized small protein (DUF1192 family)
MKTQEKEMSEYQTITNTIARLRCDINYYREAKMWNRVAELRLEIARLEAILNPKKAWA